ncbi:hypothetical protein HYW75_05805 [Candidatus Pacearchaeota archaeon]|nr:hypothetical protein [Candidatus Pacearchaeota archaeon]
MTEINTLARKWGDSIAIIIPKKIAEAEKIIPESKVRLIIKKEDDLSDLFGKPSLKKIPQELKNEERRGWE